MLSVDEATEVCRNYTLSHATSYREYVKVLPKHILKNHPWDYAKRILKSRRWYINLYYLVTYPFRSHPYL